MQHQFAARSDLALALAADLLGDDEKARDFYRDLKFLCGFPHKNFYAHLLVMRILANGIAESLPFPRPVASLSLLQSA
jgi:hypothetical protein